ncbi:MAG: phage holin family protein [Sulfuricellaceae bacterium]|nr:phage holin family protein [Sulfuricellaceae bacterium]
MKNSPDSHPDSGLFESLKGLAVRGVSVVKTRLELLSVELAEEKEYLLALLIAYQMTLFFVGMSIIFLALFLLVAFWENHRLLVVGLFMGFFLLASVSSVSFVKHLLKRKSRLFSASLAELSKDLNELERGS